MAIELITGPANAGKAEYVMDGVRRHLAHGSEPLLIVPTGADVDHYRRELAGAGAAIGVRVNRFQGLIDEVVERAGGAPPAIGRLARERLLAAIAERAGGIASTGYVQALAAFIAELQVRRVTPARLANALDSWGATDGESAPTRALGELYEAYHRALREARLADQEQRAAGALDALRRRPALWGGRPVLFYGFDDLTHLQLDAIKTLGVVVDAEVTVSLAYEPGRAAFAGRAGTFQELAPLAASHRALQARGDYYLPRSREALSHLERSLFEGDATRLDPGRAVRLLEGAGERAELELVAEQIGELLAQGIDPGEIAVVARMPPPTADLLEEVFGGTGFPYALQRRRPFADTAIGGALIGLLRCVPAGEDATADDEQGERQPGRSAVSEASFSGAGDRDLLAWLRAPGLLERPELADRLEAAARRTGGLTAQQARSLWEERNWPLETIDRLAHAQECGPSALCSRAARELARLMALPRRRQASVLARDEIDEARALSAGRRALSELSEFGRAAPELAPRSATELARALADVHLLSGSPPAPGSVTVVDPLALRARRVRALFLCGLQEGVFPAHPSPQPVLGEEERRRLAEVSGLRLGEYEDALASERYLLYAAASRPEELLVLSWHTAADDGSPAVRSLFVDDVCDLFDGRLESERTRRPRGGEEAGAQQRAFAPGEPVPSDATSIAALHDGQLLAELRTHTWSPSSLEVFLSCPVRWLVERMLRVKDLDPNPEPLGRGGLAHVALKQTLEGLALQTGSARLTAATLPLARKLLERALAENAPSYSLSAVSERQPALRRRLQADLERYLEHAADADDLHPLEPRHLELEFGFAGNEGERDQASSDASPLPPVELGDGVRLRGRIDRVDVGAEGEAVVYDYKGRSAAPAAKWIGEGEIQVALYMRAVEQLLGVRSVGGFYQPLAGADLRARGVLDGDSGVTLESVGGDRRTNAEVRELLEQAAAAAREAAAQAGRGELRPRPRTCAFTGGCMYPTICRHED